MVGYWKWLKEWLCSAQPLSQQPITIWKIWDPQRLHSFMVTSIQDVFKLLYRRGSPLLVQNHLVCFNSSSWSQHWDRLLECCLLSAPSSSGPECSWLLVCINFCSSSVDIWRAHLLQKTCTAGCQQHIKARESPEVSNICWKPEEKGQYSWGSICQCHEGQDQMFLMLLWGPPVLLSLPASFQTTDTVRMTGRPQLPVVLRSSRLQTDNLFHLRSDDPFLQMLAGKGVPKTGTVRIV